MRLAALYAETFHDADVCALVEQICRSDCLSTVSTIALIMNVSEQRVRQLVAKASDIVYSDQKIGCSIRNDLPTVVAERIDRMLALFERPIHCSVCGVTPSFGWDNDTRSEKCLVHDTLLTKIDCDVDDRAHMESLRHLARICASIRPCVTVESVDRDNAVYLRQKDPWAIILPLSR